MTFGRVLRFVVIAGLAVALLHGLPLVGNLALLLVAAALLMRPLERRSFRPAAPEVLEPSPRQLDLQQETRRQAQEQAALRERQLESQLQALRAQLQERQARVQEQEEQLQGLKAQVLEREALVQEQEAQLQGLKTLVQEREARIQEQETQVLTLQQELQDSQVCLQDSQVCLQDAQAWLVDAQNTIDQLRGEQEQALSSREAGTPPLPDRSAVLSEPQQQGTLLLASRERDIYSHERLELLMRVLRLVTADRGIGLNGFTPSPRAVHILHDLIEANPVEDGSRSFQENIKGAFRTADTRSKLMANLTKLRFVCQVARGSGHIIVSLPNDDRYSLQISSTPGDHRSRTNEAQRLASLFISKGLMPQAKRARRCHGAGGRLGGVAMLRPGAQRASSSRASSRPDWTASTRQR